MNQEGDRRSTFTRFGYVCQGGTLYWSRRLITELADKCQLVTTLAMVIRSHGQYGTYLWQRWSVLRSEVELLLWGKGLMPGVAEILFGSFP